MVTKLAAQRENRDNAEILSKIAGDELAPAAPSGR